jgi:hypothetical protein
MNEKGLNLYSKISILLPFFGKSVTISIDGRDYMERKRPEKRTDLMSLVRDRVLTDRFISTVHALERKSQRSITLQQIKYILCNGHHEKNKDKYDECYSAWNYAIRGVTFDEIELRIIVSFNEVDDLLIITAFEVGGGRNK